MTTNTTSTASQVPAVSIDSEEFRNLLIAAWLYGDDPTHYTEGKDALVAYIDAKLAQAREEGFEEMRQAMAESAKLMADACRRATAAEAKLEAMRQGVKGLKRYFSSVGFPGSLFEDESGIAFKCDDVLALLQPQPQADESGLPG